MSAIDLFCGAGGLSLGLTSAGFEVKAALECNASAMNTHRLNLPRTAHLMADARTVSFKQFSGLDLVAGGPPCQPFSVSGKQMGADDARDMIPEFIRAVAEIEPKAFLMENVPGLTTAKFISYLRARLSELSALGYHVKWSVLNAAHYGAPQNRLRLFAVGTRDGIDFEFPAATHGEGATPCLSVREALRDTPADAPNTAKVVYAKAPILRKSPYAGMLLNGQGRPLNLDGQSHTIAASAGGNRTHVLDLAGVLNEYHAHLVRGGKPRTGEVEGCRRLTARESARLQTFPDAFEFTGRKSQQYAQIGNAVPPVLAASVAAQIFSSLS